MHPRNESQHNVSGLPAYPYCVSGVYESSNDVLIISASVSKRIFMTFKICYYVMIPQYNHPQHNLFHNALLVYLGWELHFPIIRSVMPTTWSNATAHSWPFFRKFLGE
ncbi:hypothetical protein FEM48_Zijuj09G0077900 [Ziziphus jujuba var. spinosa]|uniref:Uncharacterized protein n=1 Tax=Ziziphus jujuba var. spinosa TaxID=714518 RepID=A0A978URR0_ZIZJJ|nr:hypothetical protein FEM48_Zijuj09G0077900 [Ziziphus jujuba var. spinosa]